MRLALGILLLLLLGACSPSAEWRRVELPAGLSPVTLAATDNGLLVGAHADDSDHKPRLLLADGDRWRTVPVSGESHYAKLGRWRSILVQGDRVLAISDASGGAHFNPRWTTWEGTLSGIVEYPQAFTTFGGWGAGGLKGLLEIDQSPAIVGAWSGDRGGLDISLWSLGNHEWARGSSAGTALQSTSTSLQSVRGIGAGPALAGSVTSIGGGVHLAPAWWHGSPWTRSELPGGAGEAIAVRCAADRCLLAGYVGTHVALWDERGRLLDVPGVEAGTGSSMAVSPALDGVIVSTGNRSTLLVEDDGKWRTADAPPGSPTAWVGDYVTTVDSEGRRGLWHRPAT